MVIGAAVLQGCVKDPDLVSCDDFDRSALLSNWADNLIVPAYTDLVIQLESLDDALLQLEASPGLAQLQLARQAYVASRSTWQQAVFFDFGPASTHGLLAACHVFPCDTGLILSNATSDELNLASASNIAAGGFEALDYLLYGDALSDDDVLARLSGDVDTPLITYTQLVTAHILEKARLVHHEWDPGQGTYRASFVAATGTDVGSSLGLALNAYNRVFEEHVRKNKLGLPSGAMTFTMTPLPDHVEGYYSQGHSLAFLSLGLEAAGRVFSGISWADEAGLGLDDYLDRLGAKHQETPLSEALQSQLEMAQTAALGLDAPLASTVVNNQALCIEAYAEIQQAVVLCKVDLMSALGILVTYQDNDGD